MNAQLIAGLCMVAGLMASGEVSAISVWSTQRTLSDWQANPVVDGDGDTRWTWNNSSSTVLPGNTVVTFKETEIGGLEYYGVGFAFDPAAYGPAAGTTDTLIYQWERLDGQAWNNAMLDTIITGTNTTATADIYADLAGPSLLHLISTSGSDTGYIPFTPPLESFYWKNTIFHSETGIFDDLHNGVVIPEPFTFSLFGIGLAALVLQHRYGKF
ncbi:hypothetical protein [Methylomagnum ishizawai]|uniref:hypothetical protein n=1 Tax=Methylomagnum ishizawai TaxID=1760988 RepID=UPI001C340187|nr:hypothetical protein [Methylomagnum ishizawai]BBL75628.1 hypothetical protein MishRS11D_27260 [Methylomagnum ishizawai]